MSRRLLGGRHAPLARLTLAALGLLAAPGRALAQGYDPPSSLDWPLYDAKTGLAREALGSSFGEYQYYGEHPYVHTGIDIRGHLGDRVRLVADGNIWMTANFDDDSCLVATNCRLYVLDRKHRYIYYYSHLRLAPEGEEFTSEVREKILNAAGGAPSYPVQAGTDVSAGQVLAGIANFASGEWPHLHFGIVDATQNYDALDPLTALRRTGFGPALFDDEPPTISALNLLPDGGSTPLTTPACSAVSGPLDIAATMKDSFFTTSPAPAPVDGHIHSIGVYEARYLVRDVGGSAPPIGDTWYRFDRAPLRCAGPDRGLACSTHLTQADFFAESIGQSQGGLNVAEPYTPRLFSMPLSQSPYNGPSEETYVHLLTNAWGREGKWDTAAGEDGYYQVSVEAFDQAGNGATRSRFVLVGNKGTPAAPPEAHVRDNPVDVGALPSTLGGQPFWASPDIFVLPTGSPAPGPEGAPPEVLLEAGVTYDVYLRVSNGGCTPVEGIRAQLYSANPSMINDAASWGAITLPAGSFVTDATHPSGLSLAPGERSVLGPFTWTPTEAEATSNEGHRCLLAKIDAPGDPVGPASTPVADDNNVAQRNVQFSDTSFSMGNPEEKRLNAEISLSCNGFPYATKGALIELSVDYHPALAGAWANAEGVKVTIGPTINVRFERCRVTLPPALLPGKTKLKAKFKLVPPPNVVGEWRVDLAERLDGVARGGMSFGARAP